MIVPTLFFSANIEDKSGVQWEIRREDWGAHAATPELAQMKRDPSTTFSKDGTTPTACARHEPWRQSGHQWSPTFGPTKARSKKPRLLELERPRLTHKGSRETMARAHPLSPTMAICDEQLVKPILEMGPTPQRTSSHAGRRNFVRTDRTMIARILPRWVCRGWE